MKPEEKAKLIESDLKQADAKRRADAAEQEKLKMEKDEKAKADADEMRGNMDKILACLDSFGKRMDSFEAGMMDSKKRKDAEGEEIKEKGDPKELKADGEQPAQITGPDRFDSRADSATLAELAQIQSRADQASSAWSKSAPAPWDGEDSQSYLRRVTYPHQKHSEKWADVDLKELRGQALRNAAEQIYSDSIAASMNPAAIGAMNLREVVRRDPNSGHIIREYHGDPLSWMSAFAGQRRTARFRLDQNGR